jgi:hypothetical protein
MDKETDRGIDRQAVIEMDRQTEVWIKRETKYV